MLRRFDKPGDVRQLSDMVETTTRDFTRNFARYRAKALGGEKIRVTSPDGDFVFAREGQGITGAELLQMVEEKGGFFDDGGADAVESGRTMAKSARSPWD